MESKLRRTDKGWTVTYAKSEPHSVGKTNWVEIPLHPWDIDHINATYVDDEYNTDYIYEGKIVDVDLIAIYEFGDCDEQQVTYAKIKKFIVNNDNSNSSTRQ